MADGFLRRHESGPVSQVSGYVDACDSLDPTAVRSEYLERVAGAPTRTQPYIVGHVTSGRSNDSSRMEELLAHRMYRERAELLTPGWPPVQIVDFQTPLNSTRSDRLGKVDLLGAGIGLCVIELKVLRPGRGADTPLNAMLEAVGYCAVVAKNAYRIESELRERGQVVRSGPVSALVLAPEDYWARWDETRTRQSWRTALRRATDVLQQGTGLIIGFASFNPASVGPILTLADPLV